MKQDGSCITRACRASKSFRELAVFPAIKPVRAVCSDGVRRFYVRDPLGRLISILMHS